MRSSFIDVKFKNKKRIGWSLTYGLIKDLERLGYKVNNGSDVCLMICPEQLQIPYLERIYNKVKVGILLDGIIMSDGIYTKFGNLLSNRTKYLDIIFSVFDDDISLLKEYGIKNVYKFSCWVDEEMFRPLPIEQDIDFSFIGTIYRDRFKMVDDLKELGVRYLQSFREDDDKKKETEEYVKNINRTKINLAFPTYYEGDSGRTLEIMSCGQFVLQEEKKNSSLKDGEHLATYKNSKELIDKAKYYLKHEKERKEIAENGRKEILKKHTGIIKIKEMLNLI